MLKVYYKNDRVKKYCENPRDVQKDFGIEIAKKLSKRLDDLQSFDTVMQLLNGGIDNPHLLKSDLEGCLGWDLTANVRLIIKICDCFNEKTIEECKTITTVTVEGVRDYHGGNKKWLIN